MQLAFLSLIFKLTELSLLSSQFCCKQRIHLTLGSNSHKEELEANAKFLGFQLACYSNVMIAQTTEIKRLKFELGKKNAENEAQAWQKVACEARKVKLEVELEALTLKLSQVSMEPRPITPKDQAFGCHSKTIDQLEEENMSLWKKMQTTDLFHECTSGKHPYGLTDKEGTKIKADALRDSHVLGN